MAVKREFQRKYIVVILLLMGNLSVNAQAVFEKEIFVNQEDTLPYNILKPEGYSISLQDGQEKILDERTFPLVLFLHGAGERGIDNEKQIIHINKLFLDSANMSNYPAFVIAPQCPENKRWVEVDWSAKSHIIPLEPSWAMKNVMKLIDSLIELYPIDTTRIYVTGVSMGGYGTWDIISRDPEKFAAAIPICGGADENMAAKIKNIPVWVFHGSNDKVVPVSRARNMVNAIRQAGGHPKYTEYKGVGHGSWVKAYKEKDLLRWLFDQKLEK